ncbi:hypothetical protein XaavBphi31_08 [Xanthomonas phage Xaa_vB_phi31]|uniref:Uncharacterized protein n=1 Tax=Xanthomonas phage Xaa_vB_phi31 TaxID=2776752 RepID=A0A868BZ28_9CAUD|nr:hypothetical protein XaavBphi31_08 [Xanthomonas phage Xaa_vB_phi31]
MSVLEDYSKGDLETALIVAWLVRDKVVDSIRWFDDEALSHGICWHWEKLVKYESYKVVCICVRDDLYRQWPEFSGSTFYPIPMPESYEDDYWAHVGDREDPICQAEWIFDHMENMWDGEYGSLRMDCLDWIIHTLEEAVL